MNFKELCTNVDLGDFTIAEIDEIERTPATRVSISFARWNQMIKSSRMFSNTWVQYEFYWYQNIVNWNISISNSQGTNLRNSRAQVRPSQTYVFSEVQSARKLLGIQRVSNLFTENQ